MKILVAYTSRSGKTSEVADKIVKVFGAEKYQIEDLENRKGIVGFIKSGMEARLKKLVSIGDYKGDLTAYDLVVFATPVWAGGISSPVRSFADRYKKDIKNFALVTTRGSSKNQYLSTESDLEAVIGMKAKAFGSICSSKDEQQAEQDLGCFLGIIRELK